MQRFLTTVLAIAVIVAAVSFVTAPYFAFLALRSAAASQDVEGLSKLVDYDAVRSSLRTQILGAAAQTPAPSFTENPIGAIEHAIAPMAPTPQVEGYLTPGGLYALTMGEGHNASKTTTPPQGASSQSGPWPAIRHWGVDRSALAVASKDPAWDETVFTFERQGIFRWRLVQIHLPGKIGAPAKSVAVPAPAK
jgi:hypothetical protein